MGPSVSENFNMLLLLQIAAKRFQVCPEFSSHTTTLGILEFCDFTDFNDFFFRNFQIDHCTQWGNQKPQLSGKRATVEIWVFGGKCSVYTGNFWQLSLKSFWARSVHFRFSTSLVSQKRLVVERNGVKFGLGDKYMYSVYIWQLSG